MECILHPRTHDGTVDSTLRAFEFSVGPTPADARKSLWLQCDNSAFYPGGLCSHQGLISPGITNPDGTITNSNEQERTWCSKLFPSTWALDTFQRQAGPSFLLQGHPWSGTGSQTLGTKWQKPWSRQKDSFSESAVEPYAHPKSCSWYPFYMPLDPGIGHPLATGQEDSGRCSGYFGTNGGFPLYQDHRPLVLWLHPRGGLPHSSIHHHTLIPVPSPVLIHT